MPAQTYATPEAFKQAMERRIRAVAGAPGIARFRQVLVFDRFLARVFAQFGDRVIVKGGVVLELRLKRARTTRDVDIRLSGSSANVIAEVQAGGRLDLGDFLTFIVEPDRDHPTIQGDGMIYDGLRFRVRAMLAGKIYAGPFGLDVGFGDVLTEEPEAIDGSDFLSFAGVPRARHRVYPRVVHLAEKLHAYTLPRPRENSRVKDLPDIALLAQVGPLEAGTESACAIGGADAGPTTLRCWGNNAHEAVGVPPDIQTLFATPTLTAAGATPFAKVSVGQFDACAITTSGQVLCWGSNDFGEVGDGTKTSRPSPTPVTGLDAGFDTVSVGYSHACATQGADVYCWGNNLAGELGDGTLDAGHHYVPERVVGLP